MVESAAGAYEATRSPETTVATQSRSSRAVMEYSYSASPRRRRCTVQYEEQQTRAWDGHQCHHLLRARLGSGPE